MDALFMLKGVPQETHITDLTGHLLIAMPGLQDSRFHGSVVYLCAHSAEGAMGLIVNKPLPDMRFEQLIDQLPIDNTGNLTEIEVHFGGPVEMGRGFVLHSPDFTSDMTSLRVGDAFAMTATLDVLESIAQGTGPNQRLILLGYAGWGPGQLEQEIAQNAWLVCAACPELVFGTSDGEKWQAALGSLGVSPELLSSEGGRA